MRQKGCVESIGDSAGDQDLKIFEYKGDYVITIVYQSVMYRM